MNRRYFLFSAGTVVLGQLIAGCDNSPRQTLRIRLLKDSIPIQLLSEFQKLIKAPAAVDFALEEQLKNLFISLQAWQQPITKANPSQGFSLPFFSSSPPAIPHLTTLGDYWLAAAIQKELIQPLDIAEMAGWQQLPPRWQELATRNQLGLPDKKGKIWGAPYRWGWTAIAYRQNKFKSLGWQPQDWQDLWKPELKGRISLLNQPREVIGLVLKSLGSSYNTPDLDKVPKLKPKLQALSQQVKFYSSTTYLQPLLLEDTWLAVGWSADLLPLIKEDPDIKVIIPQSGTSLWADLWVQPATVSKDNPVLSPIQKQWIEFCWQPKAVNQISLLSTGASPAISQIKSPDIIKEVRENSLLFPDSQIFEKSEFLYPLSPSTTAQYRQLWSLING